MEKAKAVTFRTFRLGTVMMAGLTFGSFGGLLCFNYALGTMDLISAHGFATLGGTLIGLAAASVATLPFAKL